MCFHVVSVNFHVWFPEFLHLLTRPDCIWSFIKLSGSIVLCVCKYVCLCTHRCVAVEALRQPWVGVQRQDLCWPGPGIGRLAREPLILPLSAFLTRGLQVFTIVLAFMCLGIELRSLYQLSCFPSPWWCSYSRKSYCTTHWVGIKVVICDYKLWLPLKWESFM